MGMNYYAKHGICPTCGHGAETRHLGKSSMGWCFLLHVYPEERICDLPDWKLLWEDAVIVNEEGEPISTEAMLATITKRMGREIPTRAWCKENHAEPGPEMLARCVIDGSHCIGHGEGTWDLLVGEFS